MADPRTNPLLDPKNDDLISSYINKLPTSEENKDALFSVLVEPDPEKYQSGMKSLWGRGGELRELTAKLHNARKSIDGGDGLEDAFNQYVFSTGKSPIPATITPAPTSPSGSPAPAVNPRTEASKTTPPPSKEPSYIQAFNRGVAEGLSRMDQAVANVLGYIPGMKDISSRVSERAKQVQKESEEQYGAEPTSIGAQVARGIGATAPDILRHSPMARLTGPLAPIGMALTEYATNIHKGTGEASKAAVSGLAMALGGKFTKQYVGNLLDRLPTSVKAKLPTAFVDALSEGAGFAGTATGLRTLAGEETTAAKLTEEAILGAATSAVSRAASKATTKKKDQGAGSEKYSKYEPNSNASRKYELTPDPSGKVTDPFTGKSIDLKSGEMAFHVEDTTYIVSPTGVPNSYKVSQGLEGANRKYVGRYGSEPDPESLALKLHRTFSPAKQTAPPPTSAAKTPSAKTATVAAPVPASAPAQSSPAPDQPPSTTPAEAIPTATPTPKKESAKKAAVPSLAAPTPPAETAPVVEAPAPAVAPLESVYTDTPKGKPQRTVAIKFENEQQKTLYDTIQNARTGDANAVTAKAEAVNKYAQENNVSTEEAQKILEGWATKTFMRAKNQPAEAPEGKRLEIEANPVPKPSNKKPAATPPPPAAAAPAAAPEPVKPEATATETVVTPTPAVPVSPQTIKPQAPGKKEKVEASVAATPAPPPVAAAKATEPAVAPKVETETVATEAPTVEIEAPTPGKYKHSFRKDKDAELSFDSQGDLAIGLAIGNKALERHIPKLATIYVNDKPIIGNRDLSINLMREYQGYLREMPGGKAPTIEEFAKNIWKDKSKVTGVGVTKSTPISAGISETEGTQTQTRYLDRIKFLRQSIATAKAILGTEAESAKQLADLESKRGQFGGGKVNEYVIRHSDLESTSPGGELNEKAKVDLDNHQKELNQILNTQEGKKALELEAAQKTEQAEQAKRIAAASKRPARPIPVMEADLTPKPAPESKAAEILAKVEPKPVDYVPTLADVKAVSKKIGQAKEWLEDDQSVLNIRDTNETIKKAAIQKKKTELEGQAALVADLSKKKTALPASEAIKRPGPDPAALAREKTKLEKLREDIAMRENELARYQKEQIAKAKQAVKESQDRLDALRQEHAALMDRLENIPDLQVKKAVQTEINKGNVRINDLEAKVKQLQDKFMSEKQRKQTSKTESAEPKETASIEDLFPQAIEYAKDKGIVARKDLRKAFSKYGLSDKQINDMYKRLKEEGVLNEKGEAVKPEPTPVVKPEELKPTPPAEQAKPSEAKPKIEIKPKAEAKPKSEEEPKAIKVEAPVKPASAKFASDTDARAYDVWKKDPVRFGTAASEGAKVFEDYRKAFRDKNPDLNKTEAMRYIKKYMEYADKQVEQKKPVDSLDKWYRDNV